MNEHPEPGTRLEQARKRKLLFLAVGLCLLFACGLAAGYMFFFGAAKPAGRAGDEEMAREAGPEVQFRVYYPVAGQLEMEERMAAQAGSRDQMAISVVREYLKGPAGADGSSLPAGARLLGVYFGTDGILYVEFSEEFRSNFRGDALTEYLLLRGLYESLMSNIAGIEDVKVLVEGGEIESLGGHIYANLPLGEAVASKEEEAGE